MHSERVHFLFTPNLLKMKRRSKKVINNNQKVTMTPQSRFKLIAVVLVLLLLVLVRFFSKKLG